MQIFNVYLLKSHNDTALFVETDPETGAGSSHRILHDKTASAGLRYERTVEKPASHAAKVGVTSAASYPVSWEVVMSKLVGESSRPGVGLLGPGDAGGWKGAGDPFEMRAGNGVKTAVWTLERVIPALEGAGVLVKVQPGWE